MKKITLYRYEREGGGVTVSPEKPDCEYTELYRLIADEGMELVNGNVRTTSIDTNSLEDWEEVPLEEPAGEFV